MARAARPFELQMRLRNAEATLRETLERFQREVADHDGIQAQRMSLLREQAKSVLRERLRRLKYRRSNARAGSVFFQRPQPQVQPQPEADETTGSPFMRLSTERKNMINGGENAILLEFGLPAEMLAIGDGIAMNVRRALALSIDATCDACGAKLVYFDPHEHGIETQQLGCTSCGGMFELDVVVDPLDADPTSDA